MRHRMSNVHGADEIPSCRRRDEVPRLAFHALLSHDASIVIHENKPINSALSRVSYQDPRWYHLCRRQYGQRFSPV